MRETLKGFAPWVAIAVSIVVLWIQIRRARFAQSVDLILKLEQRFFESENMIEVRRKAAGALRTNRSSPASDVDDVLDFFETLGLLARKKALDKEMIWNTFYHWIHRYRLLLKDHILEKQETNSSIWEDLLALDNALVAIELKRSKSRFDIDIPEIELLEFLKDESNL